MNRFVLATSVAAAATILGACQSSQCCSNGKAGDPAALGATKAAFFAGWTKPANAQFTMDPLSKVVSTTDEFLSFDGMSQGTTVIQGWKPYAAMWGPGMNGFTTASLSEAKSLRTWCDGNTAVTASLARIQGTMPNGQSMDMLGHITLVYKWDNASGWRVVHEHMSLPVRE